MENTKHQWNQDAGLSILESRKGGGEQSNRSIDWAAEGGGAETHPSFCFQGV